MLKICTMKIPMESDFSSYLTPFLTNIGGGGALPSVGVLNPALEGQGPSQRDIKLRP